MDEAEHSCDRVALMHRGRVEAVGRPRDLTARLGGTATLDDVFRAIAGADLTDTSEGYRHVQQTRRTTGRLG
jgi:ABC-2 type transport system ATP-binding protein